MLSEFAKYAFFWPDKEKSCLGAQRTHVREHQKQDFNAVRPKKTGLRKGARRAHPTLKQPPQKLTPPFAAFTVFLLSPAPQHFSFLFCSTLLVLLTEARSTAQTESAGSLHVRNYVRQQKQVVALPSLYSPKQSEGDGWC